MTPLIDRLLLLLTRPGNSAICKPCVCNFFRICVSFFILLEISFVKAKKKGLCKKNIRKKKKWKQKRKKGILKKKLKRDFPPKKIFATAHLNLWVTKLLIRPPVVITPTHTMWRLVWYLDIFWWSHLPTSRDPSDHLKETLINPLQP